MIKLNNKKLITLIIISILLVALLVDFAVAPRNPAPPPPKAPPPKAPPPKAPPPGPSKALPHGGAAAPAATLQAGVYDLNSAPATGWKSTLNINNVQYSQIYVQDNKITKVFDPTTKQWIDYPGQNNGASTLSWLNSNPRNANSAAAAGKNIPAPTTAATGGAAEGQKQGQAAPPPPAAAPPSVTTKLDCKKIEGDKVCGYYAGDTFYSGDGKSCWGKDDKQLGSCLNPCGTDEKCKGDIKTHEKFLAWIAQQQRFTFAEGVSLGSKLWGLGEKFGFFTEASNPMAELNAFFTETKEGLFLSGNWEKSICWQETDFNNPNDGIAFVPGTETVGVWVAGEYTLYKHPSIHDPSKTITEYIYRITSVVNPSGLTINSGANPCYDLIQFTYSLDSDAIDLDLDNRSDIVRILCDSGAYSLTGENTIIRYSKKLYAEVCINFQLTLFKQGFMQQLNGGRLCAPIAAAGVPQPVGSCPYCPPILTGAGGFGSIWGGRSASTPPSAPSESRPGVANPTPG